MSEQSGGGADTLAVKNKWILVYCKYSSRLMILRHLKVGCKGEIATNAAMDIGMKTDKMHILLFHTVCCIQ